MGSNARDWELLQRAGRLQKFGRKIRISEFSFAIMAIRRAPARRAQKNIANKFLDARREWLADARHEPMRARLRTYFFPPRIPRGSRPLEFSLLSFERG
jgi:hypothetical protein